MISEVLIVTIRNDISTPVNTTVVKALSRRRATKIIEAANKIVDENFTVLAYPLWLEKRHKS